MKNMSKLLLFLMLLFAALGVNAQVSTVPSPLNVLGVNINGQFFPNQTLATNVSNTVRFNYSGVGTLSTYIVVNSDFTGTVAVDGLGYFKYPIGTSPTAPVITSGIVNGTTPTSIKLGDFNYSIGNQNTYFFLTLTVTRENPASAVTTTWYIYNDARPLPVTLTSFTAKAQGTGVNVNWATASELNFDHYEIQYSITGANYSTIAREQPKGGNTQTGRNYSYYDGRQLSGMVYYRLACVDTDGTTAYSPVVAVNLKGITAFGTTSYAVKFGDHYFSYDLPDEPAGYVLTDLTGRVVFKQDNASPLTYQPSDGRVYVLRVLTKSGQTVNHLVQ